MFGSGENAILRWRRMIAAPPPALIRVNTYFCTSKPPTRAYLIPVPFNLVHLTQVLFTPLLIISHHWPSLAHPTPVLITPSQLTLLHLTPVRTTLVHLTSVHITLVHLTPERITSVHHTPLLLTPSQLTPSHLTPVWITLVHLTPVSITLEHLTPVCINVSP